MFKLWHSNKQAAVSPLQEVSKGLWHVQECSCSSSPHTWGKAVQQDGNLAVLQTHKELNYMLQLQRGHHGTSLGCEDGWLSAASRACMVHLCSCMLQVCSMHCLKH